MTGYVSLTDAGGREKAREKAGAGGESVDRCLLGTESAVVME